MKSVFCIVTILLSLQSCKSANQVVTTQTEISPLPRTGLQRAKVFIENNWRWDSTDKVFLYTDSFYLKGCLLIRDCKIQGDADSIKKYLFGPPEAKKYIIDGFVSESFEAYFPAKGPQKANQLVFYYSEGWVRGCNIWEKW
jgi:hypothetical protein